jgi:hypothetical protein
MHANPPEDRRDCDVKRSIPLLRSGIAVGSAQDMALIAHDNIDAAAFESVEERQSRKIVFRVHAVRPAE